MGGGDGGDPWVVVMLGVTGSGKSSLGNSIYGKEAFKVSNEAESCTSAAQTITKIVDPINVPLTVVDTPGYGDSRGGDEKNMKHMTETLQDIGLVNAFLLVVNGANVRLDQQIFEMLQVYPPSLLVSPV